jgi:hypothetical protein
MYSTENSLEFRTVVLCSSLYQWRLRKTLVTVVAVSVHEAGQTVVCPLSRSPLKTRLTESFILPRVSNRFALTGISLATVFYFRALWRFFFFPLFSSEAFSKNYCDGRRCEGGRIRRSSVRFRARSSQVLRRTLSRSSRTRVSRESNGNSCVRPCSTLNCVV